MACALIRCDFMRPQIQPKKRTRGEGVQNPENFANVINGCPLSIFVDIYTYLMLEKYEIKASMLMGISFILT